jgi:hypothetical protein
MICWSFVKINLNLGKILKERKEDNGRNFVQYIKPLVNPSWLFQVKVPSMTFKALFFALLFHYLQREHKHLLQVSKLAQYSTSTQAKYYPNYHVEVPLVLSHLVFRRDVGGHGLAAGVVGHDLLLEHHHLVLVN